MAFKGWRYSNGNGFTTFVASDDETLINDNGSFIVFEDVDLTARYKKINLFGNDGNWNDTDKWFWNRIPPTDTVVFIDAAASIPSDYTAYADSIVIRDGGSLTIEDGGQLIHNNAGLVATVQKSISGYGTSDGGYNLIANPTLNALSPANLGMTTGSYDLYWFDQSEANEWRNYKSESFNLENGKGYLYANSANTDIAFTGVLNRANADISLPLAYDANPDFAGWNLVGNPYACTAYLADGRAFYTMNGEGTEIIASTSSSIEAMEGIFVIANEDGETMQFTTEVPQGSKGGMVLNLSQGRGIIDRAVVRFGEGRQLPKFQMRTNSTKLYIPQDNKDYAVVHAEKAGEMPVNFKAKENGTYTISVNTEGLELDYLHLIDNMTGADVDLLATSSYTFTAKTTDYESRFKLVFAVKDGPSTGSGTFAFISDGNIIVNGEGVLQVVDVMGRIIISTNFARNVSTSGMTPGVYVLRLIDENDVRTQKIVIK